MNRYREPSKQSRNDTQSRRRQQLHELIAPSVYPAEVASARSATSSWRTLTRWRPNCWPMRGRSRSARSRWPTFSTCSTTRPPRVSRPFASYLLSGRSWMAKSVFTTVAPLDGEHDRTPFDCGVPALNLYLRNYALQNQKKGIVRN